MRLSNNDVLLHWPMAQHIITVISSGTSGNRNYTELAVVTVYRV